MRKVVIVFAACLALLGGYYAYKNPEEQELNDAARTEAPGRFITTGVGRTHYEVAGPDTGRVAVLVHGFSVPMYIWDSTFTSLAAAGYRVIRYDLVGRGYSDRPNIRYDGATFDAQLDGLLDSLRVEGPVDLFGLSFGGFVTAHYTSTHPQRVRTLVLVDPSVRSGGTPAWYLRTPVLGRYLFQVLAVPGMAEGQPGDFLHPEKFPGWADRYRPQMGYRGFGRALLRSRITLGMTDFEPLHRAVADAKVPLLLIWGKQDPVIPIAWADDVVARIPQTEFVPIDSAGHLPHLEQTQVFNAAVLSFLSKHPPAPR